MGESVDTGADVEVCDRTCVETGLPVLGGSHGAGGFGGTNDPGVGDWPSGGDTGGGTGSTGGTTLEGLPYHRRNEDDYIPDDESVRPLLIQKLMEEIKWQKCSRAKSVGLNIGVSENCCCWDDEKDTPMKVATVLYHLLRRKIFDDLPELRACLLNAAKTKTFCCYGSSHDFYEKYGSEANDKYENSVLREDQVYVLKDKMTDSTLGERYLAEALLAACQSQDPSEAPPGDSIPIFLDLDVIFGWALSPDVLCVIIEQAKKNKENIGEVLNCDYPDDYWITARYVAINPCTGEVKRLRPGWKQSDAGEKKVDIDGPTLAHYRMPDERGCYELKHPGEKFHGKEGKTGFGE